MQTIAYAASSVVTSKTHIQMRKQDPQPAPRPLSDNLQDIINVEAHPGSEYQSLREALRDLSVDPENVIIPRPSIDSHSTADTALMRQSSPGLWVSTRLDCHLHPLLDRSILPGVRVNKHMVHLRVAGRVIDGRVTPAKLSTDFIAHILVRGFRHGHLSSTLCEERVRQRRVSRLPHPARLNILRRRTIGHKSAPAQCTRA